MIILEVESLPKNAPIELEILGATSEESVYRVEYGSDYMKIGQHIVQEGDICKVDIFIATNQVKRLNKSQENQIRTHVK